MHIKLSEKEVTTIEVENLTKNVSKAHLLHIFGHYSKAPIRTEQHFRDYSRALVFFDSKDDAKKAYEHLSGDSSSVRPKLEIKRKEESKVEDEEECTRIDGQKVYLRIMFYEYSYRKQNQRDNGL